MAIVTTCLTYVLLLAGGLVHSTGASLACPDWPLCYGMFFPPMVGNIRFEHGHRLIAAAVGLFTAITAFLIWKKERASLRPLAILAVLMVLIQIVLGGLTVIFLLPDLVSTAHLAVGTAFFSLLLILSIRSGPEEDNRTIEIGASARTAILCAAALTYLQIVLGGLVRHTESGLACLSVPDCGGEWMPPVASRGGLHMIHRFGAVIVLAAVGWAYLTCRPYRQIQKWTRSALALVSAQLVLGAFSVLTQLSLWSVMSHLGAAVALLACLVFLSVTTCARSDDQRMAVPVRT